MLFYFLYIYIYRNIENIIIDIYIYLIYVFNCADMLQFTFGLFDTMYIYIYFTTQEAVLEEKYCNAYMPLSLLNLNELFHLMLCICYYH